MLFLCVIDIFYWKKGQTSRQNLNNANLEGAFAHSAQFDGASIVGADFTDVDLRNDALALLCEVAEGTNPVTHRETRETLYCD